MISPKYGGKYKQLYGVIVASIININNIGMYSSGYETGIHEDGKIDRRRLNTKSLKNGGFINYRYKT